MQERKLGGVKESASRVVVGEQREVRGVEAGADPFAQRRDELHIDDRDACAFDPGSHPPLELRLVFSALELAGVRGEQTVDRSDEATLDPPSYQLTMK